MMLKHSTWDSILSLQGKLAKTEKNEFEYLKTRAEQSEIQKLLQQHLPMITQAMFDRCLRALTPDSSLIFRIQVGQELQSMMAAHGRRTQLVDTGLKAWRRGSWLVQRLFLKRKTRKFITAGGAIIAIVGADGSGKSTVVSELSSWLSKTFYTKRVHLGKPKRSLLSFFVKGIAKAGKMLGVVPSNQNASSAAVDGKPRRFPGYFWMFWHVLTANDRYRTYIKARRFATNGGLVISDRFPLPQVQSMDGARLGWLKSTHAHHPQVHYLVEAEEKFYQQIMPPEILIVLKVNPETAAQRRMDEDADSARRRAQEICDIDWQKTPAYVIDANQPQDAVVAAIKDLVWSKL
jgi:thymidylate kinase